MLFPNEEINFTELDNLKKINNPSNEEINDKYVKGDVRIVTEQARYPLSSVASIVQSGDYELNPEFQRRHRWDTVKQSRLIESFIMNVPIPPIFLYEVQFAKYEVMDGLQRLTAISEFYTDKLVLEGLVEWPELNGRTYSQLPEQVRGGVDRRYLSSIILLQETAKSPEEAKRLKQLVFERINSGGVQLEPQEARNAIYNGPLNQLCITLARNMYLCRMWGIPEPTEEEIATHQPSQFLLDNEFYRRMSDVELVLRFFALRQRIKNPKGALKDYLDNYLKHGNNFSEEVLANLEALFNRTVQLVYDTFGEKAFRLWRPRKDQPWGWYDRPAMTAYDPIMYVFSHHLHQSQEVLQRRDNFQQQIMDFYEVNYESFGGRSTTNLSNIIERNNLFENFVKTILD